MLLGVLMLSAAAGYAQESRQDVSFSGTGIFGPTVHGAANVQQSMTGALGLLISYRYMLTPRSAIEVNYSFAQDSAEVCDELSSRTPGSTRASRRSPAAYVYSFNFKRFSPFAEAGVGTLIFTPVLDNGTNLLGTKSTKGVAGLFGGGLAYELSPSFDIRARVSGLYDQDAKLWGVEFQDESLRGHFHADDRRGVSLLGQFSVGSCQECFVPHLSDGAWGFCA